MRIISLAVRRSAVAANQPFMKGISEKSQPSPAVSASSVGSVFDRKVEWRAGALVLILLLVVACVWPAMHAPPFTDDIFQLEKSSGFKKWTDVFQPDAFFFFRPVKNALFMWAAALEANMLAWHWIGLVAYLAATLGIYRITTVCLESKRAALLATAVWALSPTCASTAIWLSCANISLGIALGSGMFYCHERMMKGGGYKWIAGCVFFYALTLMCYESLIAIPGLLFLRDLQQGRLSFNKAAVIRYGVYTLVALSFLIVRHEFSARDIAGNQFHSTFAPDTKAWQLSLSAPWFLWRHFLMWIFPFGTIEVLGSFGWLRSTTLAGVVFAWVFLGLLLGLAAATWKRFPAFSYGVLFFIVASLPAGNFIPNFNGPINDAYLSIPSIGLAMAFAVLCERLVAEFVERRRTAEAGVPMLAGLVIVLLVYRLPACAAYYSYWAGLWNTPAKMVLLMADTRPFQFHSKGYASTLLFKEGYVDGAEELAKESLAEAPWSEQAKLTLARVADYRKDYPVAESRYGEVISAPKVASNLRSTALSELAHMLFTLPGRQADAADVCRELLNNPGAAGQWNHVKAVLLLAKIYQEEGKDDKARATLVRGLETHKDSDDIRKQLAVLGTPQSSGAPKTQ